MEQYLLVRQRGERLGSHGWCVHCEGRGHLWEGVPQLNLILWIIHPRKGASRGVEVGGIRREDLPSIRTLLLEAAERNASRFSGVSEIPDS